MSKYIKCPNPHCDKVLVLALTWEDDEEKCYIARCYGESRADDGCDTNTRVEFNKLTGEWSNRDLEFVER